VQTPPKTPPNPINCLKQIQRIKRRINGKRVKIQIQIHLQGIKQGHSKRLDKTKNIGYKWGILPYSMGGKKEEKNEERVVRRRKSYPASGVHSTHPCWINRNRRL
jgi:hypothetical protein